MLQAVRSPLAPLGAHRAASKDNVAAQLHVHERASKPSKLVAASKPSKPAAAPAPVSTASKEEVKAQAIA